ncbi:MAG: hypothetical protein ACI9TY_001840 [Alphaproteobacteria bacterium]|jgi:hypothetical protein
MPNKQNLLDHDSLIQKIEALAGETLKHQSMLTFYISRKKSLIWFDVKDINEAKKKLSSLMKNDEFKTLLQDYSQGESTISIVKIDTPNNTYPEIPACHPLFHIKTPC